MPSIFLARPWTRGVDRGFKIGEFPDKSQQATSFKYAAHLLTHLGQRDLAFSGVDFLNGFKNYAQPVTGNMTHCRKIKNKTSGALSNGAVEKFMQFVSRRFIDIASGSDNKNLTTSFSMYRHH
jgi:hypothetical protein